jgi:hypothetical protein
MSKSNCHSIASSYQIKRPQHIWVPVDAEIGLVRSRCQRAQVRCACGSRGRPPPPPRTPPPPRGFVIDLIQNYKCTHFAYPPPPSFFSFCTMGVNLLLRIEPSLQIKRSVFLYIIIRLHKIIDQTKDSQLVGCIIV